jgi:predicted glycogen debranching enzyme
MTISDHLEWLETDGLGGFASGTASGIRTRRYHALLLTATTPPTGRVVLVNGFEAWVEIAGRSFAVTTHRYEPDVLHPDGTGRIVRFAHEPWPTWEFELPGGVRIVQEIFVAAAGGPTWIAWTLLPGSAAATLRVRPLISGRDYHALHHENGAFRFDADLAGARVAFTPYDGLPSIVTASNGSYRHAPDWFRNFLYTAERERGLEAIEDLASPGVFEWALSATGPRAIWMLKAGGPDAAEPSSTLEVTREYGRARVDEQERRRNFTSPLDRAADAYLVQRGGGRTIIAGYPWFTDWGRDTFIAIRGLCLAMGRIAETRDILVEWAGSVSDGMLPNRFPDRGELPEFNSVDASLWYVVAASELLSAAVRTQVLTEGQRSALASAILAIVAGHARGTRFGIRMDDDGLLAAGVAGVQLTWMDARVGDRVITPRIGKPVEIQVLWLNALAAAAALDSVWAGAFDRGRSSFVDRFWSDERGWLADVVDVDHVRGERDFSFRPNQILAVGGLPFAPLEGARARQVVDSVERRLLTPLGLRSLGPGEPGYAARYEGSPSTRDAVYHQGTAWPWLLGPFVDAWVRVHGNTAEAKAQARRRFLEPLRVHVDNAGLGHVSEIADAEPPYTPRGCPFQAWSLGELLRLDRVVLGARRPARRRSAEPQSA